MFHLQSFSSKLMTVPCLLLRSWTLKSSLTLLSHIYSLSVYNLCWIFIKIHLESESDHLSPHPLLPGQPVVISYLDSFNSLLTGLMWELDYKESWVTKNWCFWTVVLEKTLESPLDCKEIQPVRPKGNQSWIFTGRTDAEAETPILWPPDAKNWLTGKGSDAGKDWKQDEKGTTEDEMVGWHHWLDWHEFEQAPGDGDGQGSLACCSPWGHKELDVTELLN